VLSSKNSRALVLQCLPKVFARPADGFGFDFGFYFRLVTLRRSFPNWEMGVKVKNARTPRPSWLSSHFNSINNYTALNCINGIVF
jgi:hypothetical protein